MTWCLTCPICGIAACTLIRVSRCRDFPKYQFDQCSLSHSLLWAQLMAICGQNFVGGASPIIFPCWLTEISCQHPEKFRTRLDHILWENLCSVFWAWCVFNRRWYQVFSEHSHLHEFAACLQGEPTTATHLEDVTCGRLPSVLFAQLAFWLDKARWFSGHQPWRSIQR